MSTMRSNLLVRLPRCGYRRSAPLTCSYSSAPPVATSSSEDEDHEYIASPTLRLVVFRREWGGIVTFFTTRHHLRRGSTLPTTVSFACATVKTALDICHPLDCGRVRLVLRSSLLLFSRFSFCRSCGVGEEGREARGFVGGVLPLGPIAIS